MIDLGRELETLGLAEQIAMHPKAAHREAELRLVAETESEGARQAVCEADIDRQLAVGIERRRRLDAHAVEHAERGELAAQGVDLAGIVELALLEGHTALQEGGVDLFGSRKAHRPHAGDGSR